MLVLVGMGLATAAALAQQPADSSSQTFRAAVDVIRIDASVLDKDRRPVRGLTAEDFTVFENGRQQRIVAVQEIDAVANDPTPSAWMRYAPRDVAGNDLADQLGDGQAIAIVMDDDHIPFDDSDIVVATRDLARYIINSLRPSDMAAVIFPVMAGETQDFTNDRSKLLEAVDRFAPQAPDALAEFYRVQPRAGGLQGDMQRYSPVIGRDPCLQNEPVLPTLRTTTARMSTIPNQRKTVLFLSTGSPVRFEIGGSRCQGIRYEEMRATFRQAQRYNVNIHGLDPAGYRGMENYLTRSHVRNGRLQMPADTFGAHQIATSLQEFLKVNAEQTGGRAVIDSMDVEADVDRIFEESSSYYLIGYETSDGNPDGKFRRVEVKVRNRDLTVRAKNGYWAPDKDDPNQRNDVSPTYELRLSGLASPVGLPLRAVIHPLAVLPNGDVDVASVLTVRVPAPRAPAPESLTLIRTANDLDGRVGRPVQLKLTRTIEPGAGDAVRYDVLSHFPLAPGRYEVRFNATSTFADASGTVYADIEIADLRRAAIAVPGVALGYVTDAARTDDLASVMAIAPTTSRDFTKGDRVRALMRVFQGGDGAPVPVSVTTRILGSDDAEPITLTSTLEAERFESSRAADYEFDLPFDRLAPGLHLLSVTASLPQGRTVRRDVVFRLR